MSERAKNRSLAALFLALCLALPVGLGVRSASAAPEPSTIANVFNTAVNANTNVFPAKTPTANRGSVAYRLTICLTSTDSIVNVQISDGTAFGFDLNDGTALTAGRMYTFTWGAHSDYSYSIQYETGTTTGYLLLEEIRDGVV